MDYCNVLFNAPEKFTSTLGCGAGKTVALPSLIWAAHDGQLPLARLLSKHTDIQYVSHNATIRLSREWLSQGA